jgi:hypothetical protein
VVGNLRQIAAAGAAATVALDLVAVNARSLAPIASDLAHSCLRLAATLQAAGAHAEARALLDRAEAVLAGPPNRLRRPKLVAIAGGVAEGGQTPPRRPALRLVTTPTA